MSSPNQAAVVFVDADNTLWDTDAVFAVAQLNMLAAVEHLLGVGGPINDRLDFVRSIDQSIAERHHAGLRYPPKLLANALALALKGTPPQTAGRQAWKKPRAAQPLSDNDVEDIEATFASALGELPSLRSGVGEGLRALHKTGCTVFVITEGARDRVIRIAKTHHINDLFDRIIEASKSAQIYTRALQLIGSPVEAFMVGDQLDRDIAPAKMAGLKTIYFPGGFRPRWEPVETDIRPDYRIKSFGEVPEIVLAKLAERDNKGSMS